MRLLVVYVAAIVASSLTYAVKMNNRPIIGVLAQECTGQYEKIGKSFIGAAYIKYVESAGARAVPVRIGQSDDYYEDIFNHTNGLLLPGGRVSITKSKYAEVVEKFFKMATKSTDEGDPYPIFGICLGFQSLIKQFSSKDIIGNYEDEDHAKSLIFEPDYKKSKMYGNISDEMAKILSTLNVTVNYHHHGVSPQDFHAQNLSRSLRILSTNKDDDGKDYISSYEAKKYPFYGVQFHPEKNLFVWVHNSVRRNIPHSYEAVIAGQYFADFFIKEARKSQHKYPNVEAEQAALIYNYNVTNTVGKLTTMNQVYAFDD